MKEIPPALMEYRQIMSEEDFLEFMVDLITTFKDVTPDHLAELKTAFADKDQEAFRRAAHSLKSSGRTFQLNRFTTLATELEELDSLEDEKAVKNTIHTLEHEAQIALDTLDGFLVGP